MTIRASLTRKYSRSHLPSSSSSSPSFAFVNPVLYVFHAYFFSDAALKIINGTLATTPAARNPAIINQLTRDVGDYECPWNAYMQGTHMSDIYTLYGPGQFRALASIMEGSLIS